MAKSKYPYIRGGFGGEVVEEGPPIGYSGYVDNNPQCHLPSVTNEYLVQIIIRSEDRELSRDGDPSLIVVRTRKLNQEIYGMRYLQKSIQVSTRLSS